MSSNIEQMDRKMFTKMFTFELIHLQLLWSDNHDAIDTSFEYSKVLFAKSNNDVI